MSSGCGGGEAPPLPARWPATGRDRGPRSAFVRRVWPRQIARPERNRRGAARRRGGRVPNDRNPLPRQGQAKARGRESIAPTLTLPRKREGGHTNIGPGFSHHHLGGGKR